jgi:hypothetical protein
MMQRTEPVEGEEVCDEEEGDSEVHPDISGEAIGDLPEVPKQEEVEVNIGI